MRLVDVPVLAGPPPDWLVDAIVDEACAERAGPIACLRPGQRHEETLYDLPNLPESRPRLRENGVVLITGGTGGLGLLFAGALYDMSRARFVLTAPWDPPPEDTWVERAKRDDRMAASLAGVLALRARGAEVAVVKADVSLRDDVERALAFARQRYGALHGVIHAAGVLHPTSVIDKTHESAHRVFAAKALGAFHLDALTRDDDLDLFMPVSSQASQVPEPGQVDYAAANAVLDVIADNRARRGRGYAGTIGWGPWQDVGIAADRMRQAVDAGVQRAMSGGRGVRDVEYDVLDHPVLRARAREVDGTLAYRGVLRYGHWLVDDHRLDGRPLLVGTAHLQLVATAFAEHVAGAGAIELRDVAHQRPLFPEERGTEIEVRFVRSRDGERFTLRSRALGSHAAWVENTTGEARRVDAPRRVGLAPPAQDLFDGLPNAPFGSHRLVGGPRWGWTRRSIERDGRAWHRIELPEAFAGDLDVFDLHPALFDAAVSCTTRGSQVQLIPHTYDTVRVHAPLEREILVMVVQHATGMGRVADVAILAPDGRLLGEIDGLVMRPAPRPDVATESQASDAATGARRIVVGDLGDLDSIRVAPLSRRAPGPGEVEIEVRATGLNFRDVLSALGEMPNVAAGMTPGSEVAGVVTAVGPAVKRLAVGDAVAGITRGALATHVTTSAHALAVLPPDLDFRRAAGVPLVFLTAAYALEKLARVQPGERVLIHAAAGGVGLAAVQIARRLRAEIYATAGDDDKRSYLRALGIRHVFDSRSLSFADGVREATGGEGVDVVLNALAGPFIPASLALLRPQGRFIEIGKRDLIAGTALDLSPFLRNLSFAAFDLGQIVDARDPMLTTMLESLLDRFASGELQPLPTEVVPFEHALDGFRRMARAQHIGKIVFEVTVDTTARGASARAFSEAYGHGVPVDFGLDVFRRVLSWPHAPTYVLAMGAPVAGAGAAPAHMRVASSEKGRGRAGLATAFRAPEGEVEVALAKLWEKTLGIAPIGVDDDFVELGGDSIEAIQIQHAIHHEFDLRIKNTEFLVEPTIAALARLIEARRAASAPVANDAGMAVRA
jgi:NADPH:quinone reductase-like Zn-dependent oxidoreductase/NAD(P)-dependent dehydrogenase (short-subunit alcohol dehydrogenase family)/acyl carrier protein